MQISYSTLSKGRQEAFERFGSVHQLPILRSPYEYLKKHYSGGCLLDIGAGAKLYVKGYLELDEAHYHSLDTDEDAEFTYRAVEEIPPERGYDWMVLNQVLEHLNIETTADVLHGLHSHLHPGGRLLATVPNVSHPIRYRTETHVTPWSYGGLYAVAQATGYRVEAIYRYSKNRGPLDPLSWLVERVMRHLYRIDWCDSIMIVATR